MNFEKKIQHFGSSRLAILTDDYASDGKTVLFACGKGFTETDLNRMLHISASQVYVTLNPERARAFELEPMLRSTYNGQQSGSLKLLQSVEAREGIHTGISMADRAKTIAVLSEQEPNPKMLVKPGHIFPLQTVDGGVLVRAGLAEACSDISFISSSLDMAVIVDLLDEQGEYPGAQYIKGLADRHDLPVFALSEVIVHRLNNTSLVEKVSEADLPLGHGTIFRMRAYRSKLDAVEHVALVLGEPFNDAPVLTRVHQENLFTDLFSLQTSSQQSSLKKSVGMIEKEGKGLIVYLRKSQKDAFKARHEMPVKTSVFRDYGIGAQIVKDCGAKKLSLLSSSNLVPEGLESFGLQIEEVINMNI